jgi:hypothetical protein
MREIFYLVNYREHLQAHNCFITEIQVQFYEVKLKFQTIVAFPGVIFKN